MHFAVASSASGSFYKTPLSLSSLRCFCFCFRPVARLCWLRSTCAAIFSVQLASLNS
ncbi:hypothetical protein BKA67DRAFT_574876 [Truncatella angustata]|uniref:Uncharacterized protein n=1 Tax=Truncatella angustata TaxID=152316 RepID=A0A9P8UEK3_9PEZI|nr:uncharacterized protein BKA67DRAFT_574876 [Truncatella angustata]KAH6648460.1 hypothetical protein BKA67DRAFT_574876 [Truncatella angustata]